MAIPNPNPNIVDGIVCDNKTWSSSKINSAIYSAAELPEVTPEDEGKALMVNSSGDWGASDIPSQLPEVPTITMPNTKGSTIVADGSKWVGMSTATNIGLSITKDGDSYSYTIASQRTSSNADILAVVGAGATKLYAFQFDVTLYFKSSVTPLGDNITSGAGMQKIKCSQAIYVGNDTYHLYFPFALNNSGTVRTGYFIIGVNSVDNTKTVTFIETTPTQVVEITDTLEAGETSLTFTDASITTNSNIRILTSVYGIAPTAATATTGSLTLTFAAQASDLEVKVVIY